MLQELISFIFMWIVLYICHKTQPHTQRFNSTVQIFSYNNKMPIIEGKRSRDVFSYFGMCHHVCHSNIAMAMAENFASVLCRSISSFPCVVDASSFRVNGNSNCYLMRRYCSSSWSYCSCRCSYVWVWVYVFFDAFSYTSFFALQFQIDFSDTIFKQRWIKTASFNFHLLFVRPLFSVSVISCVTRTILRRFSLCWNGIN